MDFPIEQGLSHSSSRFRLQETLAKQYGQKLFAKYENEAGQMVLLDSTEAFDAMLAMVCVSLSFLSSLYSSSSLRVDFSV